MFVKNIFCELQRDIIQTAPFVSHPGYFSALKLEIKAIIFIVARWPSPVLSGSSVDQTLLVYNKGKETPDKARDVNTQC